MSLEHKLSGIWDDIELREESGALVLHSDRLEEIQRPIQESAIPYLGKVITYLKYIVRSPREKNLQRYFAQGLEDHLEGQIEHGDEANRENYTNLLTAFRDYHNVHINHLKVNHQDKTMPGILKRWAGLWTYMAYQASAITASALDYQLPPALAVAGIFLIFGSVVSMARFSYRQELPDVSIDLDEVKEDVQYLFASYRRAFGNYLKEDFKLNDAIDALEREAPSEDQTYNEDGTLSMDLLEDLKENLEKRLESIKARKREIGVSGERIVELKEQADAVLRRYCPSKDLQSIEVIVEKLKGVGGQARVNGTMIYIDSSMLVLDNQAFLGTYAHEVAHTDGVRLEGMADYTTVQVLAELARDESNTKYAVDMYWLLMNAARQTYGIERKRQIRGRFELLYHMRDVVAYQAKSAYRRLTGKEPLLLDDPFPLDKQIAKELGTGYLCDSYDWRNTLNSAMRSLVRRSWLFRGNYPRGLYLIAKDRGRFLPPPKNKPNSTE